METAIVTFNYTPCKYNEKLMYSQQLKDEFLHGWCQNLQKAICVRFPQAEPYEIFELSEETSGEYWNDHQIVKLGDYFIDIRGIFTESQILEEHKREYVNAQKIMYDKKKPQRKIIEIADCYLSKCGIDNDISEDHPPYILACELLMQIESIIEKTCIKSV